MIEAIQYHFDQFYKHLSTVPMAHTGMKEHKNAVNHTFGFEYQINLRQSGKNQRQQPQHQHSNFLIFLVL